MSSEGTREDALFHLRDGSPVRVRQVRPDDRPAVRDFVGGLCRESLELRFFSAVHPESIVDEIVGGPFAPDRVSLVLETVGSTPSRIVGHAEYIRFPADPSRAEVAFLIADDFQGHGAATLLLRQLARIAREAGIRTFSAVVLNENQAMRDVFTRAGYPYTLLFEREEALLELDIREKDPTALAVIERNPPAATAAG
jgi:acetate---CoA ligase (ADP-forming)